MIYRVAVVGMVFFGSIAALQTVWSLADLFMGLMVFTNLIAISFLSKFAYAALVDYIKQKKQGKRSCFRCKFYPWLTKYRVLGWTGYRRKTEGCVIIKSGGGSSRIAGYLELSTLKRFLLRARERNARRF